jgi:hypothetical protein
MTPQDDELTPQERALFAALPREHEPGRLLEERVVRALRERGALEAGGRRVRIPAAWVGGAVAASLALFTGGVAVGQWMGARSIERVVAQIQAENTRQAAFLVQQTGSAYVRALGQLAQVSDTAPPAQAAQAREVAVRGLHAAADELVRIAPDDPVASGIMAGFDRSRAPRRDSATVRPGATAQPKAVWF